MIARPIQDRDATKSGATGSWFSGVRFGGIVAVLIALTCPDVLLGDRTFVFRDYGFFSYPVAYWFRQQFWLGEVPLWNPSSSCGIPFLAQWNTLVCYPLSLIYLCLPLPWSLGFFTLLHWFLGAAGMYCLANTFVNHRFAASVAGVAYAFNGLTINCLMWPHMTAALGWMPWVILAVVQAWRKGGRRILVAAILCALQLLTGAPELILLTWCLLILLYLLECRRLSAPMLQSAGRIVLVILLFLALSAVQLLPFLDLLRHSNRDATYFNAASSLPLHGWINFLIPLFRSSRSPVGIYYQPEQFWTTSYYLGVITLALAVVAVWRTRRPLARWFAAAAVLSVTLALGDNTFVYRWLRKLLPVINLINFPVKYLLLLPCLISLMAAFGIGELKRAGEARASRRSSLRVLAVLTALIAGILLYGGLSGAPHAASPVVWWSGITRILFLVAGFALLSLCESDGLAGARFRRVACAGVLFLIWLDVATHTPRQNPTVSNLAFQPGLRQLTNDVSPPSRGTGRLLLSREARVQSDRVTLADPLSDYLGHRLSQTLNCNLLDGLDKVDGFYPLSIKEHLDVLRILYTQTNTWSSPLADFMSVSHVSTPGNPLEFSPRGSFAPLVTAGQAPRFADGPTTLRDLGSGGFDPGRTVYLPLEAQRAVGVTNSCDARIVTSRWLGQRAEIELDAPRACLVVLAQTGYHPWRATVNGTPARIWRANHAFQAIEAPAGPSRIVVKYVDRAFLSGLTVSILALSLVAISWKRVGNATSRPADRSPANLSVGRSRRQC